MSSSGNILRHHSPSVYDLICLTKSVDLVSSSHYKNWLFESPPLAGFQTTNFGVSSAEGARNTKIGFIMRIAEI